MGISVMQNDYGFPDAPFHKRFYFGTRKDMEEAIAFAVDGKVKTTFLAAKPEDINAVFDNMKKGEIEWRIVLELLSLER